MADLQDKVVPLSAGVLLGRCDRASPNSSQRDDDAAIAELLEL
jgi:hypothetical protein